MDQAEREDALSRVKVPAIGLIVTGALGVLLALANVAYVQQLDVAAEVEKLRESGMEEQMVETFEAIYDWSKKLGVPAAILGLLGSAFVLMGGLKMNKGQSHGLAFGACIVSFIPYVSGCCCLGLIFGIWGLIALSKPEVKEAFASAT